MPWQRWRFKGNKVYAEIEEKGRLRVVGGKVRLRYKLDDTRIYRVNPGNLVPLPPEEGGDRTWDDTDTASTEKDSKTQTGERRERGASTTHGVKENKRRSPARRHAVDESGPAPDRLFDQAGSRPLLEEKPPIVIFTDGACQGNPGPAGIGVVLTSAGKRKEISEYIGQGTNNIAELTAILRALELVKDPHRTVILYTDSAYAIGVLGGWKVRANADLIREIQRLRSRFPDLRIRKVAGHSGNVENERCDQLAKEAIQRHFSRHDPA